MPKKSIKSPFSTIKSKKRIIPKKIHVGFREYKIVSAEKNEVKKAKYIGLAVMSHNEIRLDHGVGDDELKVTVFHEYAHAKMYDLGLNIGLSPNQEEKWCQFISACVMELVRDPINWKVMEWAHQKDEVNIPPYVQED